VEWLRLPLVPTIWRLKVPVGAVAPILIDIVEVPGVVGFGEKTIWTPGGTALPIDRPTRALNPPVGLTVTFAVLDCPCWMFKLEGLTVIVKSCGEETCNPRLVECSITTAATPPLPEPVNVMA